MTYVIQQLGDGSEVELEYNTGNKIRYVDPTSRVLASKIASLANTDTAAKNLFILPAGAVPVDVKVFAATASDAGTTAVVSVGKTGSNTFFVNTADVKTAAGKISVSSKAANLYASVGTSAIQVVGIYAETGTASTVGSFFVQIDYYMT